jgi:hypothetical protein
MRLCICTVAVFVHVSASYALMRAFSPRDKLEGDVKLKTILVGVASCAVIGALAITAASAAGLTVTEYDITNIDLSSWMEFTTWRDGWDEMFRQTQSAIAPSVTPLPAVLPLYGAGLGVVSAAAAWRRRLKASKPRS